MLFAIDLDEDFIDVESVTVTSMISFQSAGINHSELDTPEPDRLSSDGDAPLSQKILDISMTKVESVVEPNCIGNDIWRKSVAFICFHPPILA